MTSRKRRAENIEYLTGVVERIAFQHFGLETLEIIENDLARLIEVPGIGKKTYHLEVVYFLTP